MGKEEKKHTFKSGAKRSEKIKARYDLIPSGSLQRLAERYGLGAVHYGEFNWQKGLPFSDTLNHIQQHLENVKVRYKAIVEAHRGDEEAILRELKETFATSDDDLAGAAWGCFALMELIRTGKVTPDPWWEVEEARGRTSKNR